MGFDGTLQVISVDGSGDTFRVGASSTGIRSAVPTAEGRAFSLAPQCHFVFQSSPMSEDDASVSSLHLVTDGRRGLLR